MTTNKSATTRRYLKPIKCAAPRCPTIFKPKRASQRTCSPECSAKLQARKKRRMDARSVSLQTSDPAQLDQWVTTPPARKLPRHRWISVAPSGRPLSDLERRALTMSPPVDLFPMTGRAAAIRNAVEIELGHVFSAENAEGDAEGPAEGETEGDAEDAATRCKLSPPTSWNKTADALSSRSTIRWYDLDSSPKVEPMPDIPVWLCRSR